MLNKEALLCTKNPPIVFNATVEYDEDHGYYAIRKPSLVSPGIPFWISPYTGAKCILELLMYDPYASRTKFYHDQDYGDDNAHEIAVTVNGITETFTVYRTPVVLMGDVFGLSKLSGQSISVTFDPPPTDISKTDFKSSMEESVDAKQGIIDDVELSGSYADCICSKRKTVCTNNGCIRERDSKSVRSSIRHRLPNDPHFRKCPCWGRSKVLPRSRIRNGYSHASRRRPFFLENLRYTPHDNYVYITSRTGGSLC